MAERELGWVLKISGLTPSLVEGSGYTLHSLTAFIAVTINLYFLLQTTVYLISDDLSLSVITLHNFTILLLTFSSFLAFHFNRESLGRTLVQLADVFDYGEYADEVRGIEEGVTRNKDFWKVFWTGYFLLCGVGTIIMRPLWDYLWGSSSEEVYTANGVNLKLPIVFWFPFDTASGARYGFAVAVEVFLAYTCATVMATVLVIFIVVSQMFILQLRVLKLSVSKLEERAWALYTRSCAKVLRATAVDLCQIFDDQQYIQCCCNCLKLNITHHNIIISSFYEFTSIFATFAFVWYASASILIAAVGAFIIMSRQTLVTIPAVFFFASEIFSCYLICWYGEMIADLSESLRQDIYFCQWYNWDLKLKRYAIIMNEMAAKTLDMNFSGIQFRIKSFTKVMNAAYTYFNLIFALKG